MSVRLSQDDYEREYGCGRSSLSCNDKKKFKKMATEIIGQIVDEMDTNTISGWNENENLLLSTLRRHLIPSRISKEVLKGEDVARKVIK